MSEEQVLDMATAKGHVNGAKASNVDSRCDNRSCNIDLIVIFQAGRYDIWTWLQGACMIPMRLFLTTSLTVLLCNIL